MILGSKNGIAALVIGAVVVASAAGYWGYAQYKRHELNRAIVTLVADTSQRLRDALKRETSGPVGDPLQIAQQLEDQANEVDRRLETLRRMGPARNPAFFDTAELYIVTARELLRRTAATHRNSVELSSSRSAVQDLMRDAGQRSRVWFGQAMRAKDRFESDAFKYRLAVNAVGSLLESLADTRAKLAAHVDPKLLIDEELRAQAYQQASAASKRSADEVEQVRRFVALR